MKINHTKKKSLLSKSKFKILSYLNCFLPLLLIVIGSTVHINVKNKNWINDFTNISVSASSVTDQYFYQGQHRRQSQSQYNSPFTFSKDRNTRNDVILKNSSPLFGLNPFLITNKKHLSPFSHSASSKNNHDHFPTWIKIRGGSDKNGGEGESNLGDEEKSSSRGYSVVASSDVTDTDNVEDENNEDELDIYLDEIGEKDQDYDSEEVDGDDVSAVEPFETIEDDDIEDEGIKEIVTQEEETEQTDHEEKQNMDIVDMDMDDIILNEDNDDGNDFEEEIEENMEEDNPTVEIDEEEVEYDNHRHNEEGPETDIERDTEIDLSEEEIELDRVNLSIDMDEEEDEEEMIDILETENDNDSDGYNDEEIEEREDTTDDGDPFEAALDSEMINLYEMELDDEKMEPGENDNSIIMDEDMDTNLDTVVSNENDDPQTMEGEENNDISLYEDDEHQDDDYDMESYGVPSSTESIIIPEPNEEMTAPQQQVDHRSIDTNDDTIDDDTYIDKMDFADAYDDGETSVTYEDKTDVNDPINIAVSPMDTVLESNSVSMQFMITSKMQSILIDQLGYTSDEVSQLQPEVANTVIKKMIPRPEMGIPPKWCKEQQQLSSTTNQLMKMVKVILKIALPIMAVFSMGSTITTHHKKQKSTLSRMRSSSIDLKPKPNQISSDEHEKNKSPPLELGEKSANTASVASPKVEEKKQEIVSSSNELDETWLDKGITYFIEKIWKAKL